MAVLPGDILRDAWAEQLGRRAIPEGTTLIGWRTDQGARKRGRFAVRGIVVHRWKTVQFVTNAVGEPDCYSTIVMPVKVYEAKIDPAVENDFRTGEEFRYGG